jgi:hypothetical protein
VIVILCCNAQLQDPDVGGAAAPASATSYAIMTKDGQAAAIRIDVLAAASTDALVLPSLANLELALVGTAILPTADMALKALAPGHILVKMTYLPPYKLKAKNIKYTFQKPPRVQLLLSAAVKSAECAIEVAYATLRQVTSMG